MASILPRNAQRGRDVAKQLKFQLNWKVTLKKKEPDLNLWPLHPVDWVVPWTDT